MRWLALILAILIGPAAALPAAGKAPRPLPLLTQPLGHRAARKGSKRAEGADAETLELGVPPLVERQE